MISQINPAQNAEYLADAIFVLLDVHNIYFLQNERGYSLEQITDNMNQMIERMVM